MTASPRRRLRLAAAAATLGLLGSALVMRSTNPSTVAPLPRSAQRPEAVPELAPGDGVTPAARPASESATDNDEATHGEASPLGARPPRVDALLSPTTRVLQLSVGRERAEFLASVQKESLPYHHPGPVGEFRLLVKDVDGRSYERQFEVQGLVPSGTPRAWLDADGALRQGDTVHLLAVPVLVKLPGHLRAPLRCQVRGAGGLLLGAWTIDA